MARVCDCCNERTDEDDLDNVVVYITSKGNIEETEEWCEHCQNDNSFYCVISDERYSGNAFNENQDSDGDTICVEYVEAKGWVYSEEVDCYLSPKEIEARQSIPTEGGSVAAALDFYWTLPKGKPERVCMLIFDDREEVLNTTSEKKIKARIKAANANDGNPDVLNVYTRLQLIDDKLLSPDYRL